MTRDPDLPDLLDLLMILLVGLAFVAGALFGIAIATPEPPPDPCRYGTMNGMYPCPPPCITEPCVPPPLPPPEDPPLLPPEESCVKPDKHPEHGHDPSCHKGKHGKDHEKP